MQQTVSYANSLERSQSQLVYSLSREYIQLERCIDGERQFKTPKRSQGYPKNAKNAVLGDLAPPTL